MALTDDALHAPGATTPERSRTSMFFRSSRSIAVLSVLKCCAPVPPGSPVKQPRISSSELSTSTDASSALFSTRSSCVYRGVSLRDMFEAH